MMSLKTRKTRTSFGATAPPFIDYLKDILRRYPDGGQILKELIQNADDAKATEVVFIHDERSYGKSRLWSEKLGEYQGPALYAYNNAVFTDDDWEGIQKAGRSVKRHDPNKVGRFGIGFNSVYHITDVPCIFSSRHLAFMDPQEKILGEREGGFRWYLDDPEHKAALMTMHDQFQPFRDILWHVTRQDWSKVIEEDQHFDGTLFRFPLRKKKSDISDNLYDSDKVANLFDSFIEDADLSLLFLKNVTSVTLVHISVDGVANTKLEMKSSVCTDVILEADDSVAKCSTRFMVINLNSEDHKETEWLVTTCTMKEGQVEKLDSLAEKLRFFPQVDLAIPCGKKRDCTKSRLSCFLPLPNNEINRTGLPVDVNACFGLTDNRRHVKWQENDQKHDEHAVWNELLMKEVLPQAYLRIIQDAVKLAQDLILPASFVYELWPDLSQMEHRNKWYAVALDVLQHLFRQNLAVLSLAKDEKMFITPSEAILPCNGPTSPDILNAIKKTLVSCGENIVTLSASVARALNEAYPNLSTLKHVTPTFLRDILCRIEMHILSREDRLFLLEYVLSDGKYKELNGLQLLPLSDGSFRSFTNREEDTVLIDSDEFPRSLLPFCKHLFISADLSPDCRTRLKEIGRRNLFKVINIDAHQVAEYMRMYLPQDWKKMDTGPVTWDISNNQHPPLDWLQEFWKFLKKHFKKLSKFTGMPLIPINMQSCDQPVSLARLQHNTTLIFQKSKQIELPQQIAQLVNKVGGTVVTETKWLKHDDLDSYVLCPSSRSVLKVFGNLSSQDLITELESASPRAREELKHYLSHLDSFSVSEKELLSKLPLFKTMKESYVGANSKQAVLLNSGPSITKKVPIPDSFVLCVTEDDRRMLQLLKVKLLSTAEVAVFLVESIEKGACGKKDTTNIMTWILQHGSSFFSQNQTLKQKCKDLNFIEVNGELKKTSRFLNPTIQTFRLIFESDLFPPRVYTETPDMRKSLTDLGLISKDVDVPPEYLIGAAKLNDCFDSKSEALKRAHALLKMLDTNDLLSKFSHQELQHLKMLKWVPCATSFLNDQNCRREQSQKYGLFCPDEIRHSMYEDIVGHVMPLVGNFNDRLANRLHLKDSPPPEKVLENLSVLASKAKTMVDPDTNVNFKRKLRSIYEHMQKNISQFTTVMRKDQRWLWNHNKFVSPQDLVLDYPPDLDLSSYIEKVPNEFLPYKNLLQEFGLRTSLSDEEIIAILHSIQKNIEDRQLKFASSSEVKVAIEILNWMWREKKRVKDDIPVPVVVEGKKYTLKPLSTAVFCDISKDGLNELEYGRGEIHVVHDEISKATAEWLNIRLLSTCILDPELVGIEQCGQSEPITLRIKNILKEYDEDNYIFKELIQNAEDAGAGVCKFLVDFRVHRDAPDSLIDPDMMLCQGPCLWAYNNEQFTAEDWENIVRVGSASKENKMEKIGKFGLGFNTVYHVTDVPSILSGNHLLILDPNVTHLKKHIKHKTNPGIKLNLSQQQLFHCFPGQFGPYEGIFDCDFKKQSPPEPYQGTLIKLPFRTEEEAYKSEISQKVYHKHDIVNFLRHLTEKSANHLLFLKNISTLSLHSISKDVPTPPRDDNIKTIFIISKATTRVEIPVESNHMSKQHQAEQSLMKLDRKCKEVIDYSTIKLVKLTSQQSGLTEIQPWLLYNCFGTNQSLKMVLQENKKAKFSLPIGGIAVPLQIDPQTGKLTVVETDLNGHVFCFLPLSIQTGLPVNLNGTFAVTSNRKGLWENGVKRDWNEALLQDPVVTAYVTVLLLLKIMSENKQLKSYDYHKFWPNREKVSENFKSLVDAFYSILAQDSSSPELFSDGKHWCSMNRAIFLHESIEEDQSVSAFVAHVCKEHVKAPNHVIPLPPWLRNSFKQAGFQEVLESRIWNWEKFYKEVVFNNLDTMDPQIRDALILHAIDLNIKEIDHLLLRHPCIPTKAGELQYIQKLVNPCGKVACLFESEHNRLLCGTKNDFCSSKRLQRLCELGMTNDHLPLKDIIEKASTITKTWSSDSCKAYEHLKRLLELMKNHLHDKSSPHWKTLRTIAFLPAFSPGDTKMEGFPTLKRAPDIYSDRCSLLVNMTQPVLDHISLKIHNTDPLLQVLGVHDSPKPVTVLQQLRNACKQSRYTEKSTLHKITYECYKFLDQCLIDSTNYTFISQEAKSFPFILIGSTFVPVSRVAENEQFEAKPYLYVLPPAFSIFKRLWECVGVEKSFTTHQFQAVLKDLHAKHGNKPLPKNDLILCLTILNTGVYEAQEKATGDFLIPNEQGILQPASKMFYNDSPWMSVTSDVTLCHENISRVVACSLGIRTTRHHTLQNHEIKSISPFSFQFEQQEQLTVRIKNIISAYPSKKDIIKELLQNADDADATEIHFIWDKRQHGREKTFGEKWNDLQGPALCVFNNKVFSDADLTGIQQLGEGGKRNCPGKTGKYGVGFNSVYHLTDCPSILTGDKLLCISDPNQKYIESQADKAPAGIGYKLADEFKNMYIDVYKTFLPDAFPLKDGTMFRLPLRMGTMANSSKISNRGVTEDDLTELCSTLVEDPEGLILFLKNIRKIQVCEISETQKLKTIFVVEKNIIQTSKKVKQAFRDLRPQDASQSDKPITPQKAIYETIISTSAKRQSRWMIAEQFDRLRNTGEKQKTLSDKLPRAAVAARVSSKSPYPETSFQVDFVGEAFCSLPLLEKTGLPVHINANFEVDSSRRGLWKEDGQSLKSKWNESLKQNVIAPLYADLLHCIRHTLPHVKIPYAFVETHFSCSYLYFWPTVSTVVGQDWHNMVHEVYRSITKRGLEVIPMLRSSVHRISIQEIKEYFFEWCKVTETDNIRAPHLTNPGSQQINPILEDLGMTLVPFSMTMEKIWNGFRSAGVEVKDVNPSNVRAFLMEKPLSDPNHTVKDLPLPVAATLIRDEKRCLNLLTYCLSDFEKDSKKLAQENPNLLNRLPLLLTTDKVLRVFDSESPKLISEYEGLIIFEYKDQFAHYQTNQRHIKILKRFNLVQRLTVRCAVKYLMPAIQRLLRNCPVDPHSGLHVPNETMLNWLKLLWKFLTNQIKPESSSDDEESLTISDVRQLFSHCFILPVVCPRLGNKHFLQTMNNMPNVVYLHTERDISDILFKLGFMKLDIRFFHEINANRIYVFPLLHPELLDVNDKSAVLDQLCNINSSEFSKLSTDELKEVQCFLQDGVSKSKDKQDYQRKLKSLPLFETIHGNRERIDGPRKVFILNSMHSQIFPGLFTLANSNNIFLQNNPENYSLSGILNIQILNDLEYFMMFILPTIHSLSETQLLQCLKLLLSPLQSLSLFQHKDKIISSLKSVKLICSSQGRLETASYYFDESVELYQKMLPKERFIPGRFWTMMCEGNLQTRISIEQLLRELGMKHVVSEDDVINFAYQLESEAKENSQIDELKLKSSLILEEALTIKTKDKGKFLETIADIKFIFPERIRKELCNYHPQFTPEGITVKIRGSLINDDPKLQDLIWTSMPIIHLPVYMSDNLKKMLNSSGAHEQPPPHCITRNMSNICQSPCKSEELIKTRANVFRSSYALLQAQEFESQPLAGLPVVLVECDVKLVKADDVCLSLPDALDFRPYLYKISKDVMFEDFFKKIGMNEKPTAAQYCNVLAAVYADSCNKPQLNPNQQKTVKRAVQHFFQFFQTEGNHSVVEAVNTLYLPAVDGKLYPSSTLYYNDTVFEIKRLEEALNDTLLLLERLSECYLSSDIYLHHQLIQNLPHKFQPKMLSQITEERIVELNMQLCELERDCEFRGWFEKHLSSGAFRHGLICLLRGQSQGKIKQEDAMDMCKKTFGSIQIVCCKSLETKLWMEKQPLNKTATETDVFVKRGKQGCTFYLKHNNDMVPKVLNDINMTLTKEINALLGNKIESIHLPVLGQLLMCDSLEDVRKTLSKNGIRDSAETEGLLLNPPAPGADIPQEWHDALDMSFLNIFEEGEYVGYCTKDKYIYAIIVEQLPEHSGQYSHRYKIDIGEDEPIEVSCLDLYQFKRHSEGRRSTSAGCSFMELEICTSQPSYTSSSSSRPLPTSIDEAKREIDECLAEIWTLPEEERHKAIKRLYLRWHPDKNPECEDLATEAFKYLQNRILELETGKGSSNTSNPFHTGRSWNFRNFYQQWDQEARHHRRGRERFFRGYQSYSFWSHNSNVPRPNRREAQRWCRQARCDLSAACKDVGAAHTEWVLFKVHQAVEKSLTAAMYRRNGQHPGSSCISAIAAKVSFYDDQLKTLPQIVETLRALGVDAKKTQYPSWHRFPHIPNGQFKSENEVPAVYKASELLSKVEAYVS
ncbi:sacsin [Antennarius striatus]|uniref:sacsin n=1 Tax=Antennarius striatus TaxID=241820 RepID=UPI0035B1AD0E